MSWPYEYGCSNELAHDIYLPSAADVTDIRTRVTFIVHRILVSRFPFINVVNPTYSSPVHTGNGYKVEHTFWRCNRSKPIQYRGSHPNNEQHQPVDTKT